MSTKRYSLQTTRRLWPLIKDFYTRVRQEKAAGKPVCWHLSGAPKELFLAAGTVPIFCESFAAQMAAKGGSVMPYLLSAEAAGFGRDS
ncbi:MAG: hypothetical protein HYY20_02965 [Candidatus Tectomicrobia bacterium]|uniref:Uncharacterized protein n=1 Tax=Tectimicrobiota bacterium TaxID=2528274 RepID=A0A932CMF8_UNCTE|nr:hypothetical protein [Candidatus Tectomicrobia bacterium]